MQEPHDGRESTIDDFTSISPSSSTPKLPDPEFYFDSIYVVFQVENVLFRVSNRLLVKESPKFAELFGLIPQGNGAVGHIGSGDSGPIVMPDDIKSADFRCLLKVLYPASALIEPTKLTKLAKEEWISVLHLSTLWRFLSLRSTAITQLTAQLRPLEKVMLGRQCFVSSWLFSGYDAFGDIEEMISDDQGAEMGYHTALRLSRIRESRFKLKAKPYPSPIFGLPTPQIPRIGVEDTFKDELVALRLKESEYAYRILQF